MATKSVSIPGMADLFIGQDHHFRDPARAVQAADNVADPIEQGIEAIGELLWWAGQHEDFGPASSIVPKIGLLLQQLAQLQTELRTIAHNATYQMKEPEFAAAAARFAANEAAKFVDVSVVGARAAGRQA